MVQSLTIHTPVSPVSVCGITRGSDCGMSAGSSKAPVGRSKHNGGRDFRQHAYSQHHNMLSLLLLPLPEQELYYTSLTRNAVFWISHIAKAKSCLAFIKVWEIFRVSVCIWAIHAQVTAVGLHISKQCFLLFFSV